MIGMFVLMISDDGPSRGPSLVCHRMRILSTLLKKCLAIDIGIHVWLLYVYDATYL